LAVLENSRNTQVLCPAITAQQLAASWSLSDEKIVFYIVYFAYSSLLYLILFLVLIFPFLSY